MHETSPCNKGVIVLSLLPQPVIMFLDLLYVILPHGSILLISDKPVLQMAITKIIPQTLNQDKSTMLVDIM